jgi:hypothetical protein
MGGSRASADPVRTVEALEFAGAMLVVDEGAQFGLDALEGESSVCAPE